MNIIQKVSSIKITYTSEQAAFDKLDDGIGVIVHTIGTGDKENENLSLISKETLNGLFNMSLNNDVYIKYKYRGTLHNENGPALIFYRTRNGKILKKRYYLHGQQVEPIDLPCCFYKRIYYKFLNLFGK